MAHHVHLVTVHVPVVLMPLALVLLGLGAWRGRAASLAGPGSSASTLTATGRCLILVSAFIAGVAYFSGPLAFESLEAEMEAVRDLVELHAVLGRAAFFGLVLLAVPTVFAVLRELEEEAPSRWLDAIVIAGAALLSYLLLWAGHFGGAIRRPEIADALAWLFPAL